MIKKKYQPGSERGAALVIAIFSLMLISVVATSLILTAGTQTAIRSNYKSAMHAFYDAKAGLEEARGRLWSLSSPPPNPVSNCVFPGGGSMPIGRVCYITNPSAGETVDPTVLDPSNPYADFEYNQEWGKAVTADAVQPFISSVSPIDSANIAGPLYKWVRITPRTEASANLDIDADGIDKTPLFFDGLNVFDSKRGVPAGAAQVLTITSLAVTPYGSRRMVQYTVAPASLAAALPSFPSALTLAGNNVTFTGANKTGFSINGVDLDGQAPPPGTPPPGVNAIGFTNNNDSSSSNVLAGAVPASDYVSPSGSGSVAIGPVTVPSLLQTPDGLDALAQAITASADKVVTGPVTQSNTSNIMPSGMSATNPMIVVVNGDLTFNGWRNTGYGILLVTGQFKYDPDASWYGIILVIGKGVFVSTQGGSGQVNGAVLVANTRDSAGNLLNYLGPASFTETGGGNGIRYSSNFVKNAQALLPYQVLSFREIAQTTP